MTVGELIEKLKTQNQGDAVFIEEPDAGKWIDIRSVAMESSGCVVLKSTP